MGVVSICGFVIYFLKIGNNEFIWYIGVMIGFLLLLLGTLRFYQTKFS